MLQWTPHLLAAEVYAHGHPELAEEPSFRAAAEMAGRVLATTGVPGGLSLTVNGWTRVEAVVASPPAAPDGKAAGRRTWSPLPPRLIWCELPPADAYDLTPFDAKDRPGATTRHLRPEHEPLLRFEIGDRLEPGVHLLLCHPASRSDVSRFDRLALAALRLAGHGSFVPEEREVELQRGKGQWVCPPDFRGVVAVAGRRAGRRYLLDCRSVFNGKVEGRPLKGGEWRAVAESLGCQRRDDQPWPQRSHLRLAALGQAAAQAGLPANLAALHPRGVLRFLVLRDLGVAQRPAERAIRDLEAAPTFESCLERSMPGVLPLLQRSSDLGARLWILAHASTPDLPEIVKWAADSPSSLALAATLHPLKRRARMLAAKLRDGCELRLAVDGLAAALDRALRTGRPAADLEARIAAAERSLAEEDASRLTEAPPAPSGRARFGDWTKLRAEAQAWRATVDRVLAFCERGEWTGTAAAEVEEGGIAGLARRVERLAMRVPGGGADDPQDTDRLRRLVAEILDGAEVEQPAADREVVLYWLTHQVQPFPERWSALRAAVRHAASLASKWPQLAAALALDTAADGEPGVLTALFLQLLEDLPEAVRQWRWLRPPRLVERDELETLLASPGHPRILAAYGEAEALYVRLCGTPGLPDLAAAAPVWPAELSRAGFHAWWDQLRGLDCAVEELVHRAQEQQHQVVLALAMARSHFTAGNGRPEPVRGALSRLLERDAASVSRYEFEALLGVVRDRQANQERRGPHGKR